ncbi:hypothetical protein [Paenibacillus planticolens]|uniref:hypothetical protein n=1 Tax=Paenibacillus planticolens TaxID=2654976 RepID=UPI001491E84B|nr:hypothetical protein [Paenibacillus planticolens]
MSEVVESTTIASAGDPGASRFYGEDALAGKVVGTTGRYLSKMDYLLAANGTTGSYCP